MRDRQWVALTRRRGRPRWPLLYTYYTGVRPTSTRNTRLVTSYLQPLTQQTRGNIYYHVLILHIVDSVVQPKFQGKYPQDNTSEVIIEHILSIYLHSLATEPLRNKTRSMSPLSTRYGHILTTT